jgi:signal transduction histidine kinase/uncharacterized membrane protein YjfL (UPF0719 family)
MGYLFWNPLSITYLVETILTWVITVFFIHTAIVSRDKPHIRRGTRFLVLAFGGAAIGVTLQLLSQILHPDFLNYPLAWVSPFAALGTTGFILFSYTFLNESRFGVLGKLMLSLMLLVIGYEIYVAIQRTLLLERGVVEYREAWLDIPFVLCFFFSTALFFGKLLVSLRQSSGASVRYPFVAAIRAMAWNLNLSKKEDMAARALIYVTLIPVLQGMASLLRSYGAIDWRMAELLIGWLYLLFLGLFTLVYLNFVPERSSFRTKLVGAALICVLMLMVGVSWVIGQQYVAASHENRADLQGSSFRFVRMENGAYSVSRVPLRFDEDVGQRLNGDQDWLEFPFPFPFFGEFESGGYISKFGSIGFERKVLWRELLYRYGTQSVIYILSNDITEQLDVSNASGLFVKSHSEQVTITWNRLVSVYNAADEYSFQIRLFRNGTIEMAFLNLPDTPKYDVYRAHAAPILTGIVPKKKSTPVAFVDFETLDKTELQSGQGIVDYHRMHFLQYLDRLYEPIAIFILLSSLAVLIVFPYFFSVSLDRPLKELLAGVREIRKGRLTRAIRVSYRDEIGYLASSFNEMAKSQHELIHSLEDKVVARTAEASLYADKNARLEERNRLSQELHDAVSQTLFSANLIADGLPEQIRTDPLAASRSAQHVRELNKNALVEMRNLLLELRNQKMASSSFAKLLGELVADCQAQCRAKISLSVEADPTLPSEVKHAFYRIAQEALTNAAKHSDARTVSVYFDGMPSQAILSVQDDGAGFRPDSAAQNSFGLEIMKERMVKIQGHLEIDSWPGQGTRIVAIWMDDHA